MTVLGLFVAVYVTGGNVPGVEIVPQDYKPLQQCKQEAADRNAKAEPITFYEGKPVLMMRYACVTQIDEDVADQLKAFAQ